MCSACADVRSCHEPLDENCEIEKDVSRVHCLATNLCTCKAMFPVHCCLCLFFQSHFWHARLQYSCNLHRAQCLNGVPSASLIRHVAHLRAPSVRRNHHTYYLVKSSKHDLHNKVTMYRVRLVAGLSYNHTENRQVS